MATNLLLYCFAAAALGMVVAGRCPNYNKMICQMNIESVIDIETELLQSDDSRGNMDIDACREFCLEKPECKNFTFFQHEASSGNQMQHKCVLFRECDDLKFCATCTTGPSDCNLTSETPQNTPVEAVPTTDSPAPSITTSRRPFKLDERPRSSDTEERGRLPKQLEQQFDGGAANEEDDEYYDDADGEDDDDYVDPFNVDDGLLQDENEIEDFPDEDEEEEEARQVEETTVTPVTNDNDEDVYDEGEEDEGNPNDDAETIDTNEEDKNNEGPNYFHCMFGGYGPFGVINSIGHLGRFPFQLFSPIPSYFPLGYSGIYTTYSNGSLYLCSPGAVKQTTRFIPGFGFGFGPRTTTTEELQSGSCVTYNSGTGEWQKSGGEMNSYRDGGSMTKLGNFMVATGGRSVASRFGPSVNTIEVMSTRRPGKWRVLQKFRMPNPTHDHCTVAVNRTAMFVAGGAGQDSEAYIIDLKSKKRQRLQAMKQPRNQHSCKRVIINGRDGVIAAGGQSDANSALNSLEFYDLNRGEWFSLGRMRVGRRFPSLSLMSGRLVVSGGEATDTRGQTLVMDGMEMLQGRRWQRLQQKLPEARSRFSLQRIPTRFFFAKKK